MKNRLIPAEHRQAVLHVDESRRSGRSTAIALRAISDAISNPNSWIGVRDHHGTWRADVSLLASAEYLASQLGLQFMEFRQRNGGCYLRCCIFEEPKK